MNILLVLLGVYFSSFMKLLLLCLYAVGNALSSSPPPHKDGIADRLVAGHNHFNQPPRRSLNNRIIESFPPSLIMSSNPIVRRGLSSLPVEDSRLDVYTPNLHERDFESYEILPEYEFLDLGKITFASKNLVEFDLKNKRDMKIIYMNDCRDEGLPHVPHPLLELYWYNREALSTGIQMDKEILFVSPPAQLPLHGFGNIKTQFQMDAVSQNFCSSSGGTVRFALVQFRESLVDVRTIMRGSFRMSRNDRFVIAMQLGVNMIASLELIHSQNLIHGNISPETVKVGKNSTGTIQLVFTAFDHYSGYIDGSGVSEKTHPGKRSLWFSPWELISAQYTKRDEIFRAVQTIANWLCYLEYEIVQQIMTPEALLEWKLRGNIFVVPEKSGTGTLFDPVNELTISATRAFQVRAGLARIQSLVRTSEIENPKYREIIVELRRISWLIRTPDSSDNIKKRKNLD